MGKTEDLMLSLEKQNQQLLQQVGAYNEKLKHLEELTTSYQQLKDKLQAKRQEYLLSAREEAKKLLAETNQQIENTIRAIREHGAEKEATLKARKALSHFKGDMESGENLGSAVKGKGAGMRGGVDVKPKVNAATGQAGKVELGASNPTSVSANSKSLQVSSSHVPVTNAKQLVPGALVKSTATEAQGEVLEVKKDKAWVAFGVIKMWVPIGELLLTKKPMGGKSEKTGKSGGYQWVERQSLYNTKIDVRGKRMEEATQEVLTWLEEGYSLGHQQLKIVHGRGDGILRKGLKSLLKTVNFVRSYHHETEAEGGDGALMVQLL
jgi:DNA mismatch repair protein MutS2